MSKLLEMLGCRYPVIQGPIGMFNSPEMVAAVSEAGGYGLLAVGFINEGDTVRRLIDDVRKLTDKPFGANVVLLNPSSGEFLKILADAGVKTVTTSVGSPRDIYPVIHDLGMKGLHVVLAAAHAISAAKAGVDGLVVVGSEAGGLRTTGSESSTMVLVPLVADAVDVPIVAAGGIADSRGYRAALALGAQGVQIGTRFLASEESPAGAQVLSTPRIERVSSGVSSPAKTPDTSATIRRTRSQAAGRPAKNRPRKGPPWRARRRLSLRRSTQRAKSSAPCCGSRR